MLFSGNFPFAIPRCCKVDAEILGPHLLRFVTLCHFSRLSTIIRTIPDYSHYSCYSLLGIIRCSLLAIQVKPIVRRNAKQRETKNQESRVCGG